MPKTYTFPNGFRVIYEQPVFPTEITHVDVFCRSGSAFEPESLRGVSHFIEHMCFKGTQRRPTTRDIFKVYDDIGAYFNAYTEKQFTCYMSSFINSHTKQCIDTLGDMMLRSKFDKTEYKKELNVVIEENVRNLTDYSQISGDIVESLIYKGSSYAYPIDSMKYHKIVDSWDYANVIDFYHKYYVPENMLLSIVTTIPYQTIIKLIKACEFAKYHSRKKRIQLLGMNSAPITQLIPQHNIRIELLPIANIQTAYISIGFRTCSLFSEDKYALELLRILMGGKFTSRLTMLLREQNGLTYTSSVSTTYYEHSGDITIFCVTDSANILHNIEEHRTRNRTSKKNHSRKPAKKTNLTLRTVSSKTHRKILKRGVLPIIIDMLRNLIHRGITDSELHDSKMYMDGIIKMNISKGTKPTEYNGLEWFLENNSKITPYNDLYKTKYEPITKTEINHIIRKYFTLENTNISMVGSRLPDKPYINELFSDVF